MSNLTGNVIGVDYHTETLQLCIMSPSGKVLSNRSCRNDVEEAIGIIEKFGKVARISAEACNGSTEFLESVHRETGWKKRLCHPGYVQRMKNNPDKSDKSDSELIADLDRVDYLPQVWFAPREIRDLRTLVRYRCQAMRAKKNTKLRLRSILRQYRKKWLGTSGLWTRVGMAWLESLQDFPPQTQWVFGRLLTSYRHFDCEQRLAEAELRKFVAGDALSKRLIQEPGIGLICATTIRAEIADVERFRTSKQLARFCGLTPCNASSGSRQADAGMIRAGNPILKTAILESAHRLARTPTWQSFVQKFKDAGKPYPVIIASLANRWIRQLFWKMKQFQGEITISPVGAKLESLLG